MHDATNENDFADRLSRIKEHNANRAFNQMHKLRQRNLFRGWFNVAKHNGLMRRRQESQKQNNDVMAILWGLRRWNARAQRTKEVRNRIARLRMGMGNGTIRDVFYAWRESSHVTVTLCNRLGNLARKQDRTGLHEAFRNMLNFANSKVASQD